MTEPAAIEVRKIFYEYKSKKAAARKALKGVSFSVQRGEIFGFLGPNGSGKTTLFKLLSTQQSSFEGEITVAGLGLPKDKMAVRRKIGVVFQNPSLDLKLTALENLRHQGSLYGLRGKNLKQCCDLALERFGLLDRADDFCESFSGGMRRRLEIAKCLLHGPEILLLDEPSTGLDPGARMALWAELLRLKNAGVTILVTTHLMEEAERCSRIAILSEGNLLALGSPEALKQELSDEILEIESKDAPKLSRELERLWNLKGQILGSILYLEHPHAHERITAIMENCRDLVVSIKVSRPSLEDVYLHKTGQKFWTTAL